MPMVDVFVDMPGASPTEVEQRVTRPIEKLLWEVPGVEYLYSTSSPGRAMLIVRFLVGEDEERALVRLNQKLAANAPQLPPGASPPLVQGALDRRRAGDGADALGHPATTTCGCGRWPAQLQEALKELPDISEIDDHRRPAAAGDGRARSGGARRARPRSRSRVQQALARRQRPHGRARHRLRAIARRALESGGWPQSLGGGRATSSSARAAARRCAWATSRRSTDGGGEPTTTSCSTRGAARRIPAVTLSIAKRKGINAIELTRAVERKVETVRGYLLPRDLQRLGHAQLRRDGRAEVERAALAHVPRRRVGVRAHLARCSAGANRWSC